MDLYRVRALGILLYVVLPALILKPPRYRNRARIQGRAAVLSQSCLFLMVVCPGQLAGGQGAICVLSGQKMCIDISAEYL